ncbi:MAG: hypothetical protein LBP40_07080 [Campylobacteraceae bacterium]|nr:hypothetical protein [Campylobacteraceae bacterium]
MAFLKVTKHPLYILSRFTPKRFELFIFYFILLHVKAPDMSVYGFAYNLRFTKIYHLFKGMQYKKYTNYRNGYHIDIEK